MATLGVVLRWAKGTWTGGVNYIKTLVLAVNSTPSSMRPDMVFFVLPDEIDDLQTYQDILPLAKEIRILLPNTPVDDIDLLYPVPHNYSAPESMNKAYWIPDFQHRYLPDMFTQSELNERESTFAKLAAGKDLVVFSSKNALSDFSRFFKVECQTHMLRFCTMPDPAWFTEPDEDIRTKYAISDDYMMCCNQFWKHKDHLTLFKAIKIIKDKNIKIHIVCTGHVEDYRNPEYFSALTNYINEHDLTTHVTILGLIPRFDQVQLLRHALGVVHPSLFEGWSTVVEDCRLLGKYIIYSDIDVHLEQEISRGAPFATGDAQSLAHAILENLPYMSATAHTDIEKEALRASHINQKIYGIEIIKMLQEFVNKRSVKEKVEKKTSEVRKTSVVNGKNSYRVKGTQWYAPPLAGPSTMVENMFTLDTYKGVLDVLGKLAPDDYLNFFTGYMKSGINRYGNHWRFADICTVLYVLAQQLGVQNYLEVGVRQGRSMSMVVSQQPQVDVAAFDMWVSGYAGMDNQGPDFVQAQIQRLGHKGKLDFYNGNSHDTLPAYFAQNPNASFDLITIDGDHSPQGAAQDLEDVLPFLRIGGGIVFDDIAHPAHPELLQVWRDVVLSKPEMKGFEFTELGYGVAFALRMY